MTITHSPAAVAENVSDKLGSVSRHIRNESVQRLRGIPQSDPLFSKVCASILRDCPDGKIGLEDLCDRQLWSCSYQHFARTRFADFSLTLWKEADYFLDVYVWMVGHTNIHDHNFAGAFKVMNGTYHQCSYEFKVADELAPDVRKGQLRELGQETLGAGDYQEIRHGQSFIHQVFHTDVPCVTLCLRTTNFDFPLNSYLRAGFQFTHLSAPEAQNALALATAQVVSNDLNQAMGTLRTVSLGPALLSTIHSPHQLWQSDAWWQCLKVVYSTRAAELEEIRHGIQQESIRRQKIAQLLSYN